MTGAKKTKSAAQGAPVGVQDGTQDDFEDIDHIMNEIEELQKEIHHETQSDESRHDLRPDEDGDSSLEETLSSLKDESPSSGDSFLDQITELNESESGASDPVHHVKGFQEGFSEEEFQDGVVEQLAQRGVRTQAFDKRKAKDSKEDLEMNETYVSEQDEKGEDGCLTMTLTGNMTLKLKYAFGDQEVAVGFADGFLKVQLMDGTEFKVPAGRSKQLPKQLPQQLPKKRVA